MPHTEYQPSDEEWKCPKCGAGAEDGFCIYDPSYCEDDGDENCPKLHNDDSIICEECEFSCSGEEFAKMAKEKSTKVKCSHCNGTGWVDE